MKLSPAVLAATLLLAAGCAPVEPPAAPPGTSEPVGPATTSGAPSAPAPSAEPLTLYYVAVDDAGGSGEAIGCGDSLVPTSTEPMASPDRVRAAMERLLADKGQFLGESGLYNALYQSNLGFVSASTEADTVTVELEGQLQSGGTCDDPRIERQLEQTAATAAGTGDSRVLVNGVPLEELLGGR